MRGVDAMTGEVELRLFGPLTLRCGERELSGRAFGGRKPRQLLALLALAGGRLVANERLFDALWGEEPPVNPAATLEHYVCVLRNRVAGVAGAAARGLIETGPASYRLATERVHVDLVELDAILRQVGAGRPGRSRLLDRALALAERPLLEDELVLEWAGHERRRLDSRLAQVIADAAEIELAHGHPAAAAELAARAAAHAGAPERAHRTQVLALAQLGRRDEAVAAYARLVAALARLALAPTRETTVRCEAAIAAAS